MRESKTIGVPVVVCVGVRCGITHGARGGVPTFFFKESFETKGEQVTAGLHLTAMTPTKNSKTRAEFENTCRATSPQSTHKSIPVPGAVTITT